MIDTTASEDMSKTTIRLKVRLRYRDWNAKGHGSECHRLVLEDGRLSWAADVAERITGDWPRPDSRGLLLAHYRGAKQSGELPLGTVIVEIESRYRGGRKEGTPSYNAGRIGVDAEGDPEIFWGPAHGVEHVSCRKGRDGAYVHTLIVDGQRIEARS